MLVFTRTKHGANRVTEGLVRARISAEAIHGNKSQGARERALAGFKAGATRVLVATDIAARGLDIDAVTHVINFDLPDVPESYVHRIGRTARAGASGIAYSFCDREERSMLTAIERLIRMRITVAEPIALPARPAAAFPRDGAPAVGPQVQSARSPSGAPPVNAWAPAARFGRDGAPATDATAGPARPSAGRPGGGRRFSNRPARRYASSEPLPLSRYGDPTTMTCPGAPFGPRRAVEAAWPVVAVHPARSRGEHVHRRACRPRCGSGSRCLIRPARRRPRARPRLRARPGRRALPRSRSRCGADRPARRTLARRRRGGW